MEERINLKRELKYFTSNSCYVFCTLIISIICYGYAATNISVDIDDLTGDYYVGSGKVMLGAGRFGMYAWSRILGYGTAHPYSSFAIDVMAVIMLALAAVFFCVLLRRVSNDGIGMTSCILFSCLFISYPLINEIWEYTGANTCVTGGYLLDALALLLVYEFLHTNNRKKERWRLVAAVLLLTIVCASYESLAAVYVFGTFLILAIRIFTGDEQERTLKGLLRHGMVYAGALVGGILMRFVIHRTYLFVFNIPLCSNGDTGIYWPNGLRACIEAFKALMLSLASSLFDNSFYYKPITYLMISICLVLLMTLIIVVKRRKPLLLLPVAGMLASLVLLTLIQGGVAPHRTSQVFAIFVAVTGAFLPEFLKGLNVPKYVVSSVCVILAMACVHQAVYLSSLLAANHARSNEEATVIRSIAYDLKANADLSKPIIFTGDYTLSEELSDIKSVNSDSDAWKARDAVYRILKSKEPVHDSESYTFIQTNISSVINWALIAFNSQNSMRDLFNYYGTDYIAADYPSVFGEASEYVRENQTPAYPEKGYIVDAGDYIIVNLQ